MYTILVVDDEEEIRSSIAEILFQKNYSVCQAKNGKEALHMIEKQRPDLIISDIRMPVMDGIRLLEILKKGEEYSEIPFIIVSAKTSGVSKEQCKQKGADEYISKPFNAFDLYEAIEKNIKVKFNKRS